MTKSLLESLRVARDGFAAALSAADAELADERLSRAALAESRRALDAEAEAHWRALDASVQRAAARNATQAAPAEDGELADRFAEEMAALAGIGVPSVDAELRPLAAQLDALRREIEIRDARRG
jgi:hypothetical protein